jgi:adenylylsulfate kinase
MMPVASVQAVLLTGTLGSGKTALASEVGELLGERGVPAAIVDLDWLGWIVLGPGGNLTPDDLIAKNLEAILPNFRSAGVQRLVLARTVQDRSQVDQLRRVLGDTRLTVVRLLASPSSIAERLRRRDTGMILQGHLAEADEMTKVLDEIKVEDARVSNEAPIREVAEELLELLQWA